jgi:phenylalanyl-tRNA synthetase beta chain
VVDARPIPWKAKEISLRHTQTNAVLGVEVPADQQQACLERLGLEVVTAPGIAPVTGVRTPHTTVYRIPSFRVDLKREIDLIEEVTRLFGVDKIPATDPRGAVGSNAYDAVHDQLAEARGLLTGLGLHETQGQTLIPDAAAKLASSAAPVPVANPLSSDMNVLRPSLLPGLLDALRHNLSHKTYDVALFELGRVFNAQTEAQGSAAEGRSGRGVRPGMREERRLAMAVTGHRHAQFWTGEERSAKFDIFDLKGLLEEFLEQFGVRGISFTRRAEPTPLFLESAAIFLGKHQVGELGQLQLSLAKQHDLRDAVLMVELNFDLVLARRNPAKSFRAMPVLPAIRRDVAMLVAEPMLFETVLQVVRQAKPADLESVELFDVFRGQGIPAGQKSMACAFTYRSAERTLTDVEVNSAHEKLVEQLKQKLPAVVR